MRPDCKRHHASTQGESAASAVWVVAGRSTPASALLVGALRERGVTAELIQPAQLSRLARAGDVGLGPNIALGGWRRPVAPTPEACVLATYAAAAVGGDVVGVDLLPLAEGRHVVLEVNGAVEFTRDYSLTGRDVFDEVAGIVARDVTEVGLRAGSGR